MIKQKKFKNFSELVKFRETRTELEKVILKKEELFADGYKGTFLSNIDNDILEENDFTIYLDPYVVMEEYRGDCYLPYFKTKKAAKEYAETLYGRLTDSELKTTTVGAYETESGELGACFWENGKNKKE